MSDPQRRKRKSHAHFWRAARYLFPYRRLVIVSVICALLIGFALAGGLGTLLPIMRVLITGDTLQGWVDRQGVESRLEVRLAEDSLIPTLVSVKPAGPAGKANLRSGDQLRLAVNASAADDLHALSDPDRRTVELRINDQRTIQLELPQVPWYAAAGRRLASLAPTHPVWAIASVFGIVAALAIFSNIVKFFQEYFSDKAGISAVNDIRRRLYDHALHIPMDQFGLKGTSDVTSRLVNDAQGLQEGFKTILGPSVQEPIKASIAFAVAVFFSWRLTLFVVLAAPIMVAIIRKLGTKMRRASRSALQSSAVMLGQVESSLQGVRVVKGSNAERFERRRYKRIMAKLVQEQLRMSRIDAFSSPTLETLTLFVVFAVVLYASYLVLIVQSLEPTTFFLVMACLASIGDSLRRVSKVNNVLQKANAAAARIFETLDTPVERPRRLGQHRLVRKLPPISREVRFDDLTFAYPGASSPAVDGVSLTVPKGRSLAVVGRNGSGKTTLLALLPRFYDPQGGRILIDGVDIREVTLKSLRRQISIVTQDSVIFPGSIAENVAYGIAAPDRQKVIESAKRAFAHDFIMEKPQGYDTSLEGLGGQLSGGQKQRLCIARAIYRDAPILVLDEATSQVDAESEHLIQQAIESVMHDAAGSAAARTTFVIAHRFSTILSADSIVVLERGKIVGQGKHDVLLNECPVYRQLYERQLFTPPAA